MFPSTETRQTSAGQDPAKTRQHAKEHLRPFAEDFDSGTKKS